METKTRVEKLEEIISQASGGSDQFYKSPLSGYVYTQGIKSIAEEMGAYWLLDAIFSYKRPEPFQLWILNVGRNDRTGIMGASLSMQEDTHEPVLINQEIEFTDFPEGLWTFYFIDGTLLLPCEY